MADNLESLHQHLSSIRPQLGGFWISKNSGYEQALCEQAGFLCQKSRYWDAKFQDYFLELKKGTSIWIDLVRYAEIILSKNAEAGRETVTIFCVPNLDKTTIQKLVVVPTHRLIGTMNLTKDRAQFLLELGEGLPRSLNAQASLTLKDVSSLASFIIGE